MVYSSMDCYEAAEEFTKLVDSLDLNFWVTPRPGKNKNGIITLLFVASISDGVTELITSWTAGEGIAYHWAQGLKHKELSKVCPLWGSGLTTRDRKQALNTGARLTMDTVKIRSLVRAAYLPSISDVMISLVMESEYDQDPREFGSMFDDGGDAIVAWQTVLANAPKVRSLFGSRFERALELSYNI